MIDDLRKARRRLAALAYPFHVLKDGKLVKVGSPTRWSLGDDRLNLEFEGHGWQSSQVLVEIPGGWYHPADDVEFTTEAQAVEHARMKPGFVVIPRPPRRRSKKTLH